MNYDFIVRFALQGGATQIMFFTSNSREYIRDIANDIQAISYEIERL